MWYRRIFSHRLLREIPRNLSSFGNCPVITRESFEDCSTLRLLDVAPQSTIVTNACIANGHSHSFNEIIEIEWLFQIVESPSLDQAHRIGNRPESRHDDDGNPRQIFSAKLENHRAPSPSGSRISVSTKLGRGVLASSRRAPSTVAAVATAKPSIRNRSSNETRMSSSSSMIRIGCLLSDLLRDNLPLPWNLDSKRCSLARNAVHNDTAPH